VSGRGERSFVRALTGWVAIVASLVLMALGFARMILGLRAAGYGSTEVAVALALMGAAGGLLALGISLLIWEASIRYGIRR
jgi:hypothetical protein